MAPLNPKAPEFYPKPRAQEISQKPKCLYPPRPMFFSNQFPYCPVNVKPGKLRQPHRFWFCNRKRLPPRLKQKVWVHKSRNFSPRKPLPPPKEVELESLPSPREEAKLESLPTREEAKLESLPLEEAKLESLPPLEEAKLESLPPLKEAKLESLFGDKTSVMIRNIPNMFGRKDLLRILDNHCQRENKEVDEQQQTTSSYDFLYLPMDFVQHANLGYAFVNFTNSVAAERFRREFDNLCWTDFGYKKICEISVAKYQGKEEYSQHFKDSRFPCHTDEYLPVILSPPSDGLTDYSLNTLGHRVGTRGGGTHGGGTYSGGIRGGGIRGGGTRRRSQVA